MAWNSSNKALSGGDRKVAFGAPVTINPAVTKGLGYHDGWDIERAYKEGMRTITWVFRSIDAIAGNQAKLPMLGRKDNSPFGAEVKNDPVLKLLNGGQTNPGENSYAFRMRLSQQLLISTRGAFIEIIRGRGGQPVALHLLPPQLTSPIPDPKTFVSGYEVRMPGGGIEIVKPENCLWFRHPHPLDPYLSMTPLEAAGIAMEIETLAKFYNRNFLLNDGRPGGLLVIKGDMEEDDKDELRSRFGGNLASTGHTSVIASEDGAEFIDTGSKPRDAAYVDMRRITKEEILAAFGVPESVIGNASGRTFSNAAEELRVFWMETMEPHLEMLARGFDPLSDTLYFDFDTTGVPILILAKQEREQYILQEFQAGAITGNEYRVATGRKEVDADLADAMLVNPNLAPIGNTARAMPYDPNAGAAGAQAVGAQNLPGNPTPAAVGPGGGQQQQQPNGTFPPSSNPNAAPGAAPQLDTPSNSFAADATPPEFKVNIAWNEGEIDAKDTATTEFWATLLDRTLEHFVGRQHRVVIEKARGIKQRKALVDGRLSVDALFDQTGWDRQLDEDVRPVLAGIAADASGRGGEKSATPWEDKGDQDSLDAQVKRIQQLNTSIKDAIGGAILAAQSVMLDGAEEEAHSMLIHGLNAIFVGQQVADPASQKSPLEEIATKEATHAWRVFVTARKVLDVLGQQPHLV